MKAVLFCLILLTSGLVSHAQKLTIPDLTAILDMPTHAIDTLMKKKGYRLMQKEIDSTSSLYYYSNLERNEEAPTWVRSLSYMEVIRGDLKGKMVKYRTYNRSEFQELMSYLLSNGFKTKNTVDFKDSKHTTFTNQKRDVTVKITNNKMNNGKWIKSYEFELGK